MYCEIAIKHSRQVAAKTLSEFILAANIGNTMPLDEAYQASRIYRGRAPRSSILAHETTDNCFVIVRSVNYDVSSYHLESITETVSVQTLLQVAQRYSLQILRILRQAELSSALMAVRLFEDNGKETGVEGRIITLGSVLKEKFQWSEIKESIAPLLTTFVLLKFGLDTDPPQATVYEYFTERGKLIFEVVGER